MEHTGLLGEAKIKIALTDLTPLLPFLHSYGSCKGHRKVVRSLLEAGADPTVVGDPRILTPTEAAWTEGWMECYRLIEVSGGRQTN